MDRANKFNEERLSISNFVFREREDLLDAQVVFNLSRAFFLDNQWDKGDEYYMRLKRLSPQSEYFAYLTKLRISMQARLAEK